MGSRGGRCRKQGSLYLGGRVSRRSPQRIAIGTPIQCAISIKGVNGKGTKT